MYSRKIVVSCILSFGLSCALVAGPESQPGEMAGTKVFQKVITAVGGMEKISKIKNYYADMELTYFLYNPTRQNTFSSRNYFQFPDKYRYVAETPKYTVLIAADGNRGAYQNPPEYVYKSMSKEDIDAHLALVRKDVVCIANYPGRYNIKLLGNKTFNGKTAIALSISGPDDYTLYIDPGDFLPIGVAYRAAYIGTGKPEKYAFEEYYSDYREVMGVKIPYKSTTHVDGKKVLLTVIKKMECNRELKEGFFMKPLDIKNVGGKS